MEKILGELVERLKTAAMSNLRSVILYGSAATEEFHADYSDLNVMCVLGRMTGSDLESINPVGNWWVQQGHPAPMLFTPESLQTSADVFAIEFLDIKAKRRLLYGEDFFADLEVPMTLHSHQVERELRVNLIRLRQNYLSIRPEPQLLIRLMASSISSFVTLFRHALMALGGQSPKSKREVVDNFAERMGFDPHPFHTLLDVREKKIEGKQVDAARTFRDYFESIQRAEAEFDRRVSLGDVLNP